MNFKFFILVLLSFYLMNTIYLHPHKQKKKIKKVIDIHVTELKTNTVIIYSNREKKENDSFQLPQIITNEKTTQKTSQQKKKKFATLYPNRNNYGGSTLRKSSRSFNYKKKSNKKLLLESKSKYQKAIELYDSAEMELFEQACQELIRDYHHLEVAADAAYALGYFEYSIGNFESSKIYFLYILNNHYNAQCAAKALYDLAQVMIVDYYFDEAIHLLTKILNDKKEVDPKTFIKAWQYLKNNLHLKIVEKGNRFIVLKE